MSLGVTSTLSPPALPAPYFAQVMTGVPDGPPAAERDQRATDGNSNCDKSEANNDLTRAAWCRGTVIVNRMFEEEQKEEVKSLVACRVGKEEPT